MINYNFTNIGSYVKRLYLFESENICSNIFSKSYKLIQFVTQCFKRTGFKNVKKERT